MPDIKIFTPHKYYQSNRLDKKRVKPIIAVIYHSLSDIEKLNYESKDHETIDTDTEKTVKTVKSIFKNHGCKTQELKVHNGDLSALKKIKADYIFNLVDSKVMEMRIAAVLARLHIPFSGSSSEAIHNGNNKIRSKAIFVKYHIPTPSYTVFYPGEKVSRASVPGKFPLIIKPAFEHGSIGITSRSVITTFTQLQKIVRSVRKQTKQALICEQFIKGKEIQIMVLERHGETIALPPSEMIFTGKKKPKWNIYDFITKWNRTSAQFKHSTFIAPPKGITKKILSYMQRDAIRAFYAMGFRDYARFDLRYNTKTQQWYFLEGNPNPGLSSNPEDAATASMIAFGMTFDDFVMTIVKNTLFFGRESV